MSKERARNPESYANEELLLAMLPGLMEAKGFVKVVTRRKGAMKFVDATCKDGGNVTFWLKQGWTDTRDHSAIQFGMLPSPSAAELPNSAFIDFVSARTLSARAHGASYALLVHMYEAKIKDYVAMRIDDVVVAYSAQIVGWPRRARATKMPTLFFEDNRNLPDSGYVKVVTDLEVPLELICESQQVAKSVPSSIASKKITAEVEDACASSCSGFWLARGSTGNALFQVLRFAKCLTPRTFRDGIGVCTTVQPTACC